MPAYTITVNGRRRSVEADPDTPLLWVLRDKLDLKGTKYGCGVGACGSCTVLVNGAVERSCSLQISQVDGADVFTVEGLSSEPGGRALQYAWVDEQVPQCGYCQSGQLVGAFALLRDNPEPSDADIDQVMSDYLCRCGTYQRIRRAIHSAAREMNNAASR